jgi:osmotically-inducible protein OsmY
MDLRPRYLMWVNFFMFVFGFSLVFAAAYTWAESQDSLSQDLALQDSETWETRLERSAPAVRDKSLAAAVDTALQLEPQLAGYPLEVTAHGAVIFLQGKVATKMQKAKAEEAAGRTPGVSEVQNEIAVVPRLKPQPQSAGEQRADSGD